MVNCENYSIIKNNIITLIYAKEKCNKNFLTRKEKNISSATDKALKFVDAVATRVCDCLAPEVDSPRPKSLAVSKCTFYRDHEHGCRRRTES